jgi:hypothetical protein
MSLPFVGKGPLTQVADVSSPVFSSLPTTGLKKYRGIDNNNKIIGEFDTQQEAMDRVTEIMGRDDWKHEMIFSNEADRSDKALAMLEKRGQKAN